MAKTVIPAAALALFILVLSGCASKHMRTNAGLPPPQATAPGMTRNAGEPQATAQELGVEPSGSSSQSATPAEQALIDSVNLAYEKGLQQFNAGEPAAARKNFDHAVELMLTSKFHLKQNAALLAEFNQVVDKINTLEMNALKEGNGFVPETEPSPVDVANGVTFPVNPKIKAQAIAELKSTRSDLPLVINDPVASYISYFSTSGKGTLERALERAGRYRAMISRILAKVGVPQDLIYQAVAESGFQPRAVNRESGAGGMWQFIPSAAQLYGLTRNRWVDERFDPVKSTIAYANYMKYLHQQLGDWYLAMAAYDWGAGNVQRAVERTGYADFWELYQRNVLPQETKNYVPIIIAAAIMAKNPRQYGLESVDPDPALVTDTVTTDSRVSLRLVADLVGVSPEEIAALNPSLLEGCTPVDQPYVLHLPAGTRTLYSERIAEIPPDKRDSWRFHMVVPGDTLDSVAREYHVRASEVARVNQIPLGEDLDGISSLVIPEPESRAAASGSGSLAYYRVRRGDTLGRIARHFHVSIRDLRVWNHLRSNRIAIGHTLAIAEPARAGRHNLREPGWAEEADSRSFASGRSADHDDHYRVRRGDTLSTIASRFNVSVADLRHWNHLDSNRIAVGQSLRVAKPVKAGRRSGREGAVTRRYQIRPGDSLSTIASRFNVTVDELRSWNHLDSNRIIPGRTLSVSGPERRGDETASASIDR